MEKVFIGNLAGDVDEGSLRKLLEQEGIYFNNLSMRRNYAFITCEDKSTSEKIVQKLNGYKFEGSIMQVEPSNGRRGRRSSKIQITSMPPDCSKDQVQDLVNATSNGFKKLEEGLNGMINVTFNSADDAQECMTQLNEYRFEDGSQMKVEFFKNAKRPSRSNSSSNNSGLAQEFPLRIIVGSDYVGAIIGKQGRTIKKITADSRARVDIHRRESHIPDTLVTIKGSPDSSSTACQEIMNVVRKEAESLNRGEIPFRILCPNSICGRIIGRQGKVIKEFIEKSHANIVVSSYDSGFPGSILETSFVDRVIIISGNIDNCSKAEAMLSEKMRQCFEQDRGSSQYGNQQNGMYSSSPPSLPMIPPMNHYQGMQHVPMQYMNGNYGMYSTPPLAQMQPQQLEVVQLYIPEKTVGAVIGSKGQNIKSIMRMSGARVKILNSIDKNGSGENNSFNHSCNERKAVISGTSEAQWKAQFYIFEKVKNELRLSAHDEVHLRTEMNVPKQSMGRIIGKGGQNVREMQRVSSAIVQLPMDDQGDVEDIPITIIGHFYATQSAQRRIRSLMNSLSRVQPQPRRMRPGAPQLLF